MHKVFVYGSLLKGMGNHPFLKDSKFLGQTFTSNKFQMVDFGPFPGIVKHIPDMIPKKIFGEIYVVDDNTLEALDGLEGNGHFYKREYLPTDLGMAWVYILIDYNDDMKQVRSKGFHYNWKHVLNE